MQLLEADGGPKDIPLQGGSDAEAEAKARRVVLCATCRRQITTADAGIQITGKHEHVFVNPAGVLYHIRCFSEADGAYVSGEWTDEWSWFPGHAWHYAACAGCHQHLGWHYDGGFFGLIAERIREEDEPCAL